MNLKGRFSLKFKITTLIVVLLFITIFIMGTFINMALGDILDSTMGDVGLKIAENAYKMIEPVRYKKLIEDGDEKSQYYYQLRSKLNDLRQKSGVLYIYTMEKVGDKYVYRVDGQPFTNKEASGFGEVEKEENLSENMLKAFDGQKIIGDVTSTEWGDLISIYLPIKGPEGEQLGVIGVDFAGDKLTAAMVKINQLAMWILIGILLIGSLIGYMVARKITKPVEQLAEISKGVSEGDLSSRIKNVKRKDEIGKLYDTFGEMVDSLRSLVYAIQYQYTDLMERVKVLDQISTSAEETMMSISTSIEDVSKGSEHQLHSLTETVVEVEDVTEYVNQIKESSFDAEKLSSNAEKEAEEGREVLNLAVNQINKIDNQTNNSAAIIGSLGDKINKVTGFIKVIGDIANQTNLLALNAAIESARAGEEGQGFAVVAQEIRQLAEESSQAADNVAKTISAIEKESGEAIESIKNTVDEVQAGVSAINNADSQFETVMSLNQQVKDNTTSVADAIEYIAQAFQQINQEMEKVSYISQEANARSEEVAAMVNREKMNVEQIKEESMGLIEKAEKLREEIEKFKLDN